ncbi:MAG: GYF domain-containing protein [Planctomycetota bacterium]|nr:GYF domain-containing protein [Planctomycetota bacterium]
MSQEWYYAHGGVQKGPVTESQLKALIPLGQLLPNDLVWHDGMGEWTKAGMIKELFPVKSALPPPPPPPASKPSQPSTPVTPTAAPQQPTQTTPPAEATPTGVTSVGPSPVKKWYYTKSGTQFGPVDFGQLSQLVTTGQIRPTDLVWQEGTAEWQKAEAIQRTYSSQPKLTQTNQPAQSSVDWRHLLQNPLAIGLSFLCCWPVGLVLVGIHPRISRKTKRIVFGCFAAFLLITLIIAGIRTTVAYKQAHQANALWEEGKHEDAVAIYKSLVAGESGGMLPDSMKPTVYGRLIDHEASLGNVASATKWIKQAEKFKAVPDVRSEEAQRILSSLEDRPTEVANQASESDVVTSDPAPTLLVEATSGKNSSVSEQQDTKSVEQKAAKGMASEPNKQLSGDPTVKFDTLDFNNIDYSTGPQGQKVYEVEEMSGQEVNRKYRGQDGKLYEHGRQLLQVPSFVKGCRFPVRAETNYVYGRLHGKKIEYVPNTPQPISETTYHNGDQRHLVVWLSTYKQSESDWLNGKKHGWTTHYALDLNGRVYKKTRYEHGKEVESKKFDAESIIP